MRQSIDFFVLGAPKSGTTAIASFLDEHSALAISKPKEPHFFDARYDGDVPKYLASNFEDVAPSALCGEATPSYLMVPWVPERIAKHAPDAKLIACLRNPVERAFSSWWMLYARGLEPLDFSEAIDAELEQGDFFEREDAQSLWHSQIEAIARGSETPIRTYLRTGNYAEHLSRYLEYFPRKSIHLVLSSDMRSSRERVLNEVCDFLGVAHHAFHADQKETVNAAFGARSRTVFRIAQRLGLMRIRSLIPEGLREPIKARLSKFGEAPKLQQPMRERLENYFAASNATLEQEWGLDLSSWKSTPRP